MITKKEFVVFTPKKGKKERTPGGVQSNYSQLDDTLRKRILSSLGKKGVCREDPIPGRELSRLVGLEARALREVIERLRREGEPICSSSSGGYWLAANEKDLHLFCKEYEAHAKARLYSTSQMKKNWKKQEDLERLERMKEEYSVDHTC